MTRHDMLVSIALLTKMAQEDMEMIRLVEQTGVYSPELNRVIEMRLASVDRMIGEIHSLSAPVTRN